MSYARGGLAGGAVANYTSGEADPSKGYCGFVLSMGEKFASAYGPWGCRDYQICQAGGRPPMDGEYHCPSTIGGNTCCDANGQNCFRVGDGCATLGTVVTTWEGRPLGQDNTVQIPGAIPPGSASPTAPSASSIPAAGAPAGGYVQSGASFLEKSYDIAGFNLPLWGLLAGGFAALMLFKGGR